MASVRPVLDEGDGAEVIVALGVSTSERHAARPVATTASDSSTVLPPCEARSATIWARTPITLPTWPMRCTADTALGLA